MLIVAFSVVPCQAFSFDLPDFTPSTTNASEEVENAITIANSIEDWKSYNDFAGNISLTVDDEPYYISVQEHNMTLVDEINSSNIDIKTTSEDLHFINGIANDYPDLSITDSIKLFIIIQKTPISFDDEPQLNMASLISWQ